MIFLQGSSSDVTMIWGSSSVTRLRVREPLYTVFCKNQMFKNHEAEIRSNFKKVTRIIVRLIRYLTFKKVLKLYFLTIQWKKLFLKVYQ